MEFSRQEYWSGLPFYIDKYIFVKTKGVFCFIVTFSFKSISEQLSILMHTSPHYIFDEHNYPLISRLYLYFIFINKPVVNNLAHRSFTTPLVISLEYIPSGDADEFCRDLGKPLIFSHLPLPSVLRNDSLYISGVVQKYPWCFWALQDPVLQRKPRGREGNRGRQKWAADWCEHCPSSCSELRGSGAWPQQCLLECC
ncbi:unnamed protein product [Rangifer tarandus platyrhynchus]|uniref:Uncharacterized protein n=2 Tax=Rangifer tarandus platyrhynchus TaxID=3082113 RepID=A0AC59ZP61_RANTA|nr:unnamed protein product [Rangifer tarandus platyrhynchus]